MMGGYCYVGYGAYNDWHVTVPRWVKGKQWRLRAPKPRTSVFSFLGKRESKRNGSCCLHAGLQHQVAFVRVVASSLSISRPDSRNRRRQTLEVERRLAVKLFYQLTSNHAVHYTAHWLPHQPYIDATFLCLIACTKCWGANVELQLSCLKFLSCRLFGNAWLGWLVKDSRCKGGRGVRRETAREK
jgi:hypothetical protein